MPSSSRIDHTAASATSRPTSERRPNSCRTPGARRPADRLEEAARGLFSMRLALSRSKSLSNATIPAVPRRAAALSRPTLPMPTPGLSSTIPESLVEELAQAKLPSAHTPAGLVVRAFRSRVDGTEHLAIVRGEPMAGALVRVHSECLTGDALGSLRCDCGEQLRTAMARIGASESGALIYLRGHEGRGIGLANKIAAYALQDEGLDTAQANGALGFPPDTRDYREAADMLRALGLDDIRLLTNNPLKAAALTRHGVRVREEIALVLPSNPHNAGYMATKRDKMGHRLPGGAAVAPHAAE